MTVSSQLILHCLGDIQVWTLWLLGRHFLPQRAFLIKLLQSAQGSTRLPEEAARCWARSWARSLLDFLRSLQEKLIRSWKLSCLSTCFSSFTSAESQNFSVTVFTPCECPVCLLIMSVKFLPSFSFLILIPKPGLWVSARTEYWSDIKITLFRFFLQQQCFQTSVISFELVLERFRNAKQVKAACVDALALRDPADSRWISSSWPVAAQHKLPGWLLAQRKKKLSTELTGSSEVRFTCYRISAQPILQYRWRRRSCHISKLAMS